MTRPRLARSDDWIDPPNTVTVDGPHILLYTHDERPIRRQIGFAMQTRGTNPPLNTGKKTGKKIKGGRGC